jgi:TRAP-type C4-dicarboxylate transport system substrate-binding protein
MRLTRRAGGVPLGMALLAVLAVSLAACGGRIPGDLYMPGDVPKQQPLVMRLSHHMSADDHFSWIVEQFAASVYKRSEGRLKVYVFPNSQLLNLDDQAVDAVASGRVEAAIIPGRYVEKAVPAQAIESLPFIFDSWDGFRRVTQNETFRAALNQEYGERNLVLIDWSVSGWGWFASKGGPVIRPGDLEGLRVSVTEPEEAAMVYLAGGTPVAPGEEARAGAPEDAVDAAFVTTSSFADSVMPKTFRFYPKADAVAISNLFLVSEDFWDSLPPDLQEAVRGASREFLRDMWLKSSFDTRTDQWKSLRQGEVSLQEFNAEDRAAWVALLGPLRADYVTRAGPVGQELLDVAISDGVRVQVAGEPR